MPNQPAATSGDDSPTAGQSNRIIAWIDGKLGARADAWLDRIGTGRRNLLRVSDAFTLNDDKDALIAEVEGMGPIPLAYPKIRAMGDKLILIVFIVAIVAFLTAQLGAVPIWVIVPVVVLVVAGLIALLFLSLLVKRRAEYITPLKQRFAAITLGINHGQIQPGMDRRQVETLFEPLLKRGNYSNKIEIIASGQLTVGEQVFPYSFISYRYVDRTSDTKSNNNHRYRYHNYTRSGLVMHNAPVQGVALSSQKNNFFDQQWDTASLDFNKQCKVTAVNEMAAARFLQPTVVEKLTTWFGDEPDFELALSAEQPILMWQSHHNVFATDTDFGDANTASQLAERMKIETLPGYRQLLDRMKSLLTIIGE